MVTRPSNSLRTRLAAAFGQPVEGVKVVDVPVVFRHWIVRLQDGTELDLGTGGQARDVRKLNAKLAEIGQPGVGSGKDAARLFRSLEQFEHMTRNGLA